MMMRSSVLRSGRLALSASKASTHAGASRCLPVSLVPQRRADSTLATALQASGLQHAVSSPMLANVEKRWETMPPAEQAELWMALRKRMKVENWADMTLQEKKIAYYIAFGPHGPRARTPPGENWKVVGYSALAIVLSGVIFLVIRAFAKPPPKTMTKEWQEMTNAYLKAQNSEPITGISSEGYTGKGMVQSGPSRNKD